MAHKRIGLAGFSFCRGLYEKGPRIWVLVLGDNKASGYDCPGFDKLSRQLRRELREFINYEAKKGLKTLARRCKRRASHDLVIP